jgi:peroxiredoxin
MPLRASAPPPATPHAIVGGYILLIGAFAALVIGTASADEPDGSAEAIGPKVGEIAKDFDLKALDGEDVKLSKLVAEGPVVLVVLRGYPGYQCPICNSQVGDFLGKARKFDEAEARLVFVYPGPAAGLEGKANEFVRGKTLPENVFLVLDPDFRLTNDYSLRWDAPNETSYPATFVIDGSRKIRFAKVSASHGGRAKATEVLDAIAKLNASKS